MISHPRTSVRRAHQRAAGFTMIELFIALAVFSVGVLTLAVIVPSGAKRSDASGQQSRASEFAASKAEALLDASFTDDDLTAGLHTDPNNPLLSQYYLEWTVETDQPITLCKRVTLRVRQPGPASPVVAQLVILKAQTDS